MHLELVHGSEASYRQAVVRFPHVPSLDAWWTSYRRRMVAASALTALSSGYRIRMRDDGSIDRLVSAVVDASEEESARRYFGRLSFLESLDEDSVQLPSSSFEFESWTSDFPKLKARLMPAPLRIGADIWLASDFQIATHLNTLLREANSLGYTFAYQVHFRPFAPDRELLRRAGRNLIALEAVRGVPAELIIDQRRQVEKLRHASLLLEEIVGTDGTEAARWLTGAIKRLFEMKVAHDSMKSPQIDLTEGDCGTDLALMMHSSVLYDDWSDDDLYCSEAMAEGFRSGVLSYRPEFALARRWPPSGSVIDDQVDRKVPLAQLPPDIAVSAMHEGLGHIFVSYSHSDFQRIVPTLRSLVAGGLPFWFDRGISGGEEWDEVLERKIQDAGMILVFLSQDAVDSKYCRREIKFADAINKPLLVVNLETVALRHGLGFLLQAMQQISVTNPEFSFLLDRSIKNLLGDRSCQQ